MMPGEYFLTGADRTQRRPADLRHPGQQHRRPAGPGRLALPFLRGQSRRWSSTGRRPTACASTCPPAPPFASSRARSRRCVFVALGGERQRLRRQRPGDGAAGRSGGAAARAWNSMRKAGFGDAVPDASGRSVMSVKLSRAAYAGHYGPTIGDRIRLADTELIIEIEKDFTVYGEEVQFGGGKVIRDGQGQSPLPDPAVGAAARPGHHQRGRPRPLGHRQGRHRHPRRPHRRRRQGRQSADSARRRSEAGHRPRHRGDRRREPDSDGRRHRQPRPFHLSAAGRDGPRERA